MSLMGSAVAMSIGDSPDREQLGLPKLESRRAILSVCGALIRAGGSVLYSGDFRSGGVTLELFRYLAGVYAGQNLTPFDQYLPETALRKMGYEELESAVSAASSVCRIHAVVGNEIFLINRIQDGLRVQLLGTLDRRRIRSSSDLKDWLDESPITPPAAALTAVRTIITDRSVARVSIGGKMALDEVATDHFEGAAPGVLEECLLTLDQQKPLVPLAAFGGATRDVAIALGLLDESDRVPRGKQSAVYQSFIHELELRRIRVPKELHAELKQLATHEKVEQLAPQLIATLQTWLGHS